MADVRQKYSLWLSPKNEEASKLETLIHTLAVENDAPSFRPHVTLVGHVIAKDEEWGTVKANVDELANTLSAFTIYLSQFGFMDEVYRSLYLVAESPELDSAYELAAKYFPQVKDEHFQAMPHLSIMYGNYDTEAKQKIIDSHPFTSMSFPVQAIDVWLTEGKESTWRSIYSAKLYPSA